LETTIDGDLSTKLEVDKSSGRSKHLDSKNLSELFVGFSKLDWQSRLSSLLFYEVLSKQDVAFLESGGLKDVSLGEKFIENVIGYFQLPLGVATNFKVDGRDFVVPMAVEETSIIAAASKTAKWVREVGEIQTSIEGQEIIGQIQIAKVKNLLNLQNWISENKQNLIVSANREVASGMVRRGGGVTDLQLRILDRPDSLKMAVVHVFMNAVDAMGANIINQVCEFLKKPIEDGTNEKVSMCILSNLVDTKLTKATITLRHIDAELAEKIEEASLFAYLDPYRAATNNKGILNGIDPILIATGNDWRAVEAGVHAYACQNGQYRSISQWKREGSFLVGTLKAPLIAGTVGGVTSLHPLASMCLRMMKVSSAEQLSRILAAVGLVQNLGALRALTTVGIIEGHMKLHLRNLTLGAGAEEKEMPFVIKKLEEILSLKKRISLSHAIEVLKEFRDQNKKNQ
jgi:hydroxymethylglutaryl-CoA reductase